MDSPVIVVLAAVVGLAIGSFLNVVIARVPKRESLLTPSHCPSCEAPIRPRHNVPVLSWLALRGRCHDCRARISEPGLLAVHPQEGVLDHVLGRRQIVDE